MEWRVTWFRSDEKEAGLTQFFSVCLGVGVGGDVTQFLHLLLGDHSVFRYRNGSRGGRVIQFMTVSSPPPLAFDTKLIIYFSYRFIEKKIHQVKSSTLL